jgi:hypothetical protein
MSASAASHSAAAHAAAASGKAQPPPSTSAALAEMTAKYERAAARCTWCTCHI